MVLSQHFISVHCLTWSIVLEKMTSVHNIIVTFTKHAFFDVLQFRNININLLPFPVTFYPVLYFTEPDPRYRYSKIQDECRRFSRTAKINWGLLDTTGLVVTEADSIFRCTQEGKDIKKALRSWIYSLPSVLEHRPATSILLPTRSMAYGFALHILGTFTNTGNTGYLSVGYLNLHLVWTLNLKGRVTTPFTLDERVNVLLIYAPSREVQAEP
jgi:hypothetical protein